MSKKNKNQVPNNNEEQKAPNFISSLFVPQAKKASSRKVWSIDLETVWLPFFTATNTMGVSSIDKSALGAPLRLAYNQDGSVKFSKSGRPVIRVAKDISDNVKLVRDNFVAGLQSYSNKVASENGEAFNAMVKASIEAGKPLVENDKANLDDAIVKAAIAQAAKAEAEEAQEAEAPAETEQKPQAEQERELVPA